MTVKNPTHDEIVQTVLDILDEGSSTGRDGDPATHLAVVLDERGMWENTPDFDFPATAHHLWERINADEFSIYRFAEDEEAVAFLLEVTIERVQTEALLDLSYLVRRHLRQPSLVAR